MSFIAFLYYMFYKLVDRTYYRTYKDVPEKVADYGNDCSPAGAAKKFLLLGLLAYSLSIYLSLPDSFREYLNTKMDDAFVIVGTAIFLILAACLYRIVFYKDRQLMYFEKFSKMGCFLTGIYSIVGIFLIILPIIIIIANAG